MGPVQHSCNAVECLVSGGEMGLACVKREVEASEAEAMGLWEQEHVEEGEAWMQIPHVPPLPSSQRTCTCFLRRC